MFKRLCAVAALLVVTGCVSSLGTHSIELGNTLAYYSTSGLMDNLPWRAYRGSTLEKYIPAMEALIRSKGIAVQPLENLPKYVTISDGDMKNLDGYFYDDGLPFTIFVNRTKNPNLTFATLVHEYGHSVQPMKLGDAGQVYAESLSYLVCKELGDDFTYESFPYLLSLPYSKPLQSYSKELDTEVAFVVRKLKSWKVHSAG